MSNYSIYFSPTGGTKKVTDILGNALASDWQEIDLCREVAPMNLTAEDVCLVSVPSYGGRVPGVALDRLAAIKANGAKAVLVCVYGNREWEDTLTELQDTLECCGFVCAAAVAAVAEHSIFRQYAAGRPDADDAAELAGFAEQIQKKLDAGELGALHLEGNHGAESNKTDKDKCISCMRCVGLCPKHARDFNPVVMAGAGAAMAPKLGGHKKNHLFL